MEFARDQAETTRHEGCSCELIETNLKEHSNESSEQCEPGDAVFR